MAGIYIHIPFCKTRCIYCDFYSTTQSELKNAYIQALCKELELRQAYLQGEPVETVYFGGGTPSQLDKGDFQQIFDAIDRYYGMDACREITLEANPDDLSLRYLQDLSDLPFNRLSIGVQTFQEEVLRLLKRRHTALQAIDAVKNARLAGFNNISIDLIYGLPGETLENWNSDLEQILALDVEHISAYHLIYEEGTALNEMLRKNQIREVDEDASISFFGLLMDRLSAAGYEHYEISNFCKPGNYSLHNSAYWKGVHYLGCGPSAHSYDGKSREWNVSSLDAYMKSIENHLCKSEIELLDKNTRYNDWVITSLRTRWGLSLLQLERAFGKDYQDYLLDLAKKYIEREELEIDNNQLRLTRKGIFISDSIMSDLLRVDG